MSCACSGFRIICLFSVFSTEVLLLAHLQTSVSKVRFRRLVRKFYYLRTCRLPYLRPVFKVWDGSFSHCIPTNLRRERVKGISGCQGRLSGAACSGLRSLTAVFRVFDSLYTRIRTLLFSLRREFNSYRLIPIKMDGVMPSIFIGAGEQNHFCILQ